MDKYDLIEFSWMSQDIMDLEIGDDVYSIVQGHGVVWRIDEGSFWPLYVVFDNGTERSFGLNGKEFMRCVHQSLFKGKSHPALTK